MSRIRGLAVFLAAAVMVGVPTAARASSLTPLILDFTGAASDTLDFSGSFSSDNDVAVILFSLAAPTTISARTTSAATGGFDPILSLFRFSDPADLSTGLLIANNDDADFANGAIDSSLQSSPDMDVSPFNVLDAGLYGLVLTQSLNLSTGFLSGRASPSTTTRASHVDCTPQDPARAAASSRRTDRPARMRSAAPLGSRRSSSRRRFPNLRRGF